jgi:hypothetical protein
MKLILLSLALAAVVPLASGQSYSTFAVCGTAISPSNTTATISAQSANGGIPVLTYLNVTASGDSGYVTFWTVASQTVATGDSVSNSIPVVSVTGYQTGTLLIRHMASDTYDRVTPSTAQGLNLRVSPLPSSTVVAGDIIYKMMSVASIPVSAGNLVIDNPSGIFSGLEKMPLMVTVQGTGKYQINAACAKYLPKN